MPTGERERAVLGHAAPHRTVLRRLCRDEGSHLSMRRGIRTCSLTSIQ